MISLHVGPGGGVLPAVDQRTKVEFPAGALTKATSVMIQAFPVSSRFCPDGFSASPILTLEPRRRRFHTNINYFVPAPDEIGIGSIKSYVKIALLNSSKPDYLLSFKFFKECFD